MDLTGRDAAGAATLLRTALRDAGVTVPQAVLEAAVTILAEALEDWARLGDGISDAGLVATDPEA